MGRCRSALPPSGRHGRPSWRRGGAGVVDTGQDGILCRESPARPRFGGAAVRRRDGSAVERQRYGTDGVAAAALRQARVGAGVF